MPSVGRRRLRLPVAVVDQRYGTFRPVSGIIGFVTGEIGDATDDVGHRVVSAPAVASADAGRLYHEMRGRLVRVAAAMVGSGAIAEELVNEASVRLQPQLPSVDNPAAYVRRIVVNLALQHLRRRRVEERVAPGRDGTRS